MESTGKTPACCVIGCKTTHDKNRPKRRYRIPKTPESRRNLWLAAINRPGWEPTEDDRVCLYHFESGFMSNDSTNANYVPSIRLGYQEQATVDVSCLANKGKFDPTQVESDNDIGYVSSSPLGPAECDITGVLSENDKDTNTGLSTSLFNTLGAVGASERLRHIIRKEAIKEEICLTVALSIISEQPHTFYICGSNYEGTTTLGLMSDLDIINCPQVEVVEDPETGPADGQCLVCVRDSDTRHAYVRLQSVVNRVPQTLDIRWPLPYEEADSCGRITWKHISGVGIRDFGLERNGPADTEFGTMDISPRDNVHAFRCKTIPAFARAWINRRRPNGWPPKELIERMESWGCFFVGVGHPFSEDRYLEWRISFTLQERELMARLNPSQHKCYILLKVIKKDIIEPSVGKSVSSYHCKTALLFTIANTPASLWEPEHLIECTRLCLKQLLQWLNSGNCPNFFIQEENMFDRLDKETIKHTEKVLVELLNGGPDFVWSLRCDNISKHLYENLTSSMRELNTTTIGAEIRRYTNSFASSCKIMFHLVNTFSDQTAMDTITSLYRLLKHIDKIDVNNHTVEEVKDALSDITAFIRLQIAQCIISSISMKEDKGEIMKLVTEYDWDALQESNCNWLTCGLVHSLMYMHNNDRMECLQVLGYLEERVRNTLQIEGGEARFLMSVCGCGPNPIFIDYPTVRLIQENKYMSYEEFIRLYTCSCMAFLPCQITIVHKALQYECYRTLYKPYTLESENSEYQMDRYPWVFVDSKIYMFLLHFTICSMLGMEEVVKQAVIDNIEFAIKTDGNLGHKETAYNLLGWIYMENHKTEEAFKCFVKSLRIIPYLNAAKFHILCLLDTYLDNEDCDKNGTVIYRRVGPIEN